MKLSKLTVVEDSTSGNGYSYNQCAHDGPQLWFKTSPLCYGAHQSPIDINTSCLVKTHYPNGLEVKSGGKIKKITIEAKPYSLKFVPEFDKNNIPTVSGGPLSKTYTLSGFHFHYGVVDEEGSEHLINAKSYALELHLVFEKPGVGFAVLGKLFNVVPNAPPLPFVEQLQEFIDSGKKKVTVGLDCPVWATDFFASSFNYFHYNGSLTTPPCFENVTWLISTNIGQINPSQVSGLI